MTIPSTERGETKRRLILNAALDVIADAGVRAVTHRAVAAQAKVAVGLVNYYFKSTELLIAAALGLSVERDAQRLRALGDRMVDEDLDVDGLIDLLVAHVVEGSAERKREELVSIALTLEIPRRGVPLEVFEQWESAQTDLYHGIAKRVGCTDPKSMGNYLMASIEGLAMYAAVTSDPSWVEPAARAGLGQLLRSAAGAAGSMSWTEAQLTAPSAASGQHHLWSDS